MLKRLLAGLMACLFAIAAVAEVTVSTLTEGFQGSGGLSIDADGHIYVADFGQTVAGPPGRTVTRVDPVTGALEVFTNAVHAATGNALDSEGNLYQSNAINSNVSKIDPQGNASFFTARFLNIPTGIALDSAGNIYMASCGTEHIRVIGPEGGDSLPFSLDEGYDCPLGLAFDENDTLYVTNANIGTIYSVDGDGTATLLAALPGWDTKGAPVICLTGPTCDDGGPRPPSNGYLTYANGRLYVAARGLHQIYEVFLDGTFKVLAGTGERGNDDGPADQATFSLPLGIAASPDGRYLYVNDSLARVDLEINPVVLRVIDLGPQQQGPFAVNAGISGSWFDPDTPGQGWLLEVLSEESVAKDGSKVAGVAVMYWFTFPPAVKGAVAEQAWVVGVGSIQGNTITFENAEITSGGVFGPSFDPGTVNRDTWGDLVMTFSDCNTGSMGYVSKGAGAFGSGELSMERITSVDGLDCEAPGKAPSSKITELDASISGSWFDPDHDGEGWLIEILPGGVALVYWFTYDGNGNQAWVVGVGEIDGKTITVDEALIASGTVFGPGFDPDAVDLLPWGSFEFTFDGCDTGSMSYVSSKGGEYGSGSLELERVTALAGLACSETAAH